jgi:hypothetical protein
MAADSSRVLSSVRQTLRRKHYACRTEEAYLRRFRRFIRFHQFRHHANMDEPETEALFTRLAVPKTLPPPPASSRSSTCPRRAPSAGVVL